MWPAAFPLRETSADLLLVSSPALIEDITLPGSVIVSCKIQLDDNDTV